VERSQVHFGHTPIDYAIQRGVRQKTVAVRVDPIEGVQVRAPRGTPVEKLDQIVHRKAKWIIDRRRRQEDIPPRPTPREFVSGETFLYLGRQYRLKLARKRAAETGEVRLVGGHLVVSVARVGLCGEGVRESLVSWYRARAAARLPERAKFWAAATGLEPADVLIRDQRKRWGSADVRGIVRFNWRVIQAPMRCVDYVVAHELIHLRHPNHTRGFWSDLGQVMPDYEGQREALRRLGPMMIW